MITEMQKAVLLVVLIGSLLFTHSKTRRSRSKRRGKPARLGLATDSNGTIHESFSPRRSPTMPSG